MIFRQPCYIHNSSWKQICIEGQKWALSYLVVLITTAWYHNTTAKLPIEYVYIRRTEGNTVCILANRSGKCGIVPDFTVAFRVPLLSGFVPHPFFFLIFIRGALVNINAFPLWKAQTWSRHWTASNMADHGRWKWLKLSIIDGYLNLSMIKIKM